MARIGNGGAALVNFGDGRGMRFPTRLVEDARGRAVLAGTVGGVLRRGAVARGCGLPVLY